MRQFIRNKSFHVEAAADSDHDKDPEIINGIFTTATYDQLLPREAMRKRGLCCRPVSVNLFVRLSRWCIVSRRLKISSNFVIGPVAPSFYFFYPRRRYPIPMETLSARSKIHGVGKICDFRLKSPFISETVRDRPMVTMER